MGINVCVSLFFFAIVNGVFLSDGTRQIYVKMEMVSVGFRGESGIEKMVCLFHKNSIQEPLKLGRTSFQMPFFGGVGFNRF